MTDVDPPVVRTARTPGDWPAIRALCCRTGAGGDPIEADRWPFFAERWVGPYQRLLPSWTYVGDAGGEVVGYLTGCPHTAAFRRRRAVLHTLPLLLGVLAGRYGQSRDARRFVRRVLARERDAEEALRRRPGNLEAEYPAHLHVNVDAHARGRGLGRALVERFVSDLSPRGVRGIHLYCGTGAVGFYARCGFEELEALEVRPGVRVHALGRRLGRDPGR